MKVDAKSWKINYCMVKSTRGEKFSFLYGIEKTDKDENSLNVLQSFLEQQYGVEPGIEFQRVYRIGKPQEDRISRAIIARFLTYDDREFIFGKVNKLKETK